MAQILLRAYKIRRDQFEAIVYPEDVEQLRLVIDAQPLLITIEPVPGQAVASDGKPLYDGVSSHER